MGYFKVGKGKDMQLEFSKEKVEDISKYPFKGDTVRGVRSEICEKFGVRAGLSEKDGTTVDAFYFPSYNQKGKITGYMKQDLTKNKEEKGHWTAIGSVSISNKLFGQDVVEQVNRKRNNIVVTEGQWDALSVYQALVDSVKGTSYAGMEPFVVSIPLGTANAVESLLHNKPLIDTFSGLTVFFDDDFCTPAEKKKNIKKGHEAREDVAAALVGSKLQLFTIQPEEGYKDASDYLQNKKSIELAKLVQFGKKQYIPEKIINLSDVGLDELCEDAPVGVTVKEFPKLMDKTWGIHRRVVTLVAAPSGVGKCLAKGTKVMMHDFSLKNVEDVVTGDKLIGPDGTTRKVLSTASGLDEMYRVDQTKGISYTVNSAHILSLKYSTTRPSRCNVIGNRNKGDVVNMNVVDYMHMNKYNRERLKGWKASFENQQGAVLDSIPNRLMRKHCHKRQQIKDASSTGITVTHVGYGEYYGFTLDGDHLFCLEDGTVTHNTTAVSIIENSIGNHGFKTGLIFLEETTKETVQRKIAFELKVNYLKFKRKPLSCATREQIAEAREKVIGNCQDPSLLNHFGSIAINSLMAKVKYMHEINKCDYIVLDHISMTISGLDVVDERKDLDVVMTELAAYASSHDVGIIVVCHLNRQGTADQFKVKKGEEDKPYWVRVTKESLRGSAGLEQMSMVILGLEPEILPTRERGRIRWVVLKNRPAGELGEADVFQLNPVTWEVMLSSQDDF